MALIRATQVRKRRESSNVSLVGLMGFAFPHSCTVGPWIFIARISDSNQVRRCHEFALRSGKQLEWPVRGDFLEDCHQVRLVFRDCAATGHIEVFTSGAIRKVLHQYLIRSQSQADRQDLDSGSETQVRLILSEADRVTRRTIGDPVRHQHDHFVRLRAGVGFQLLASHFDPSADVRHVVVVPRLAVAVQRLEIHDVERQAALKDGTTGIGVRVD